MRPDFTGMERILDRISEIRRRSSPRIESSRPPAAQSRFVQVLETTERINTADSGGAAGANAVVNTGTSTEANAGASAGTNTSTSAAANTRSNASATMDELRQHISRVAAMHNIDEELIRAVIQMESSWRRDAVSPRGAMGLMQLMPRTAAMLGVEDAFDPFQNIEGGVKYLAQLTDIYKGDIEKALAAYNAGRSRVNAAGGIPNIPETQRFVRNVMALYHRYREEES